MYIDFKDPRFQPFISENLQSFEEAAAEICNQNSEKKETNKVYYFLDEIQNVSQWKAGLKSFPHKPMGFL